MARAESSRTQSPDHVTVALKALVRLLARQAAAELATGRKNDSVKAAASAGDGD